MKKLVLSATFMLASFGAFAANGEVKSNNGITSVKNSVEIVTISNTNEVNEQPVTCTITVSAVVVEFSVSWCCANC